MVANFHITGSRAIRPSAAGVIFCDGGIDDTYRPNVDLELSHWIPNCTPTEFKADTSTEICTKFVDTGRVGQFDLAVNNHVDADGVLAVFVLLHGDLALRHRQTIVQAAEMGDFWGWGEPPAQELFQTLACHIERLQHSKTDSQEIYAQCFGRIRAVLAGEGFEDEIGGIKALNESVAHIEDGTIGRTIINPRFVHYAIPRHLSDADIAAALSVPKFNAPLSSHNPLPPYARARLDGERVQLVSVEIEGGWHYDLWYPGYAWADVVQRWRPPGVTSAGTSNVHYLNYPPLVDAVAELVRRERADGQWTLTRKLSPFATVNGRNFSVVLSFMKDGVPALSTLPPTTVVQVLAPVFADA